MSCVNGNPSETVIVTIHGVGPAQPGDTVRALAKELWPIGGQALTQDAVVIAGHPLPRLLVVDNESFRGVHKVSLVELNWHDMQQPRKGLLGTADYLVRLAFAALQVAETGYASSAATRWAVRLYRLLLEGAVFWSLLLAVTALVSFLATTTAASVTALAFMGVAICALAVGLMRWSRISGYAGCAASVACFSWAILVSSGWMHLSDVVLVASRVYAYAQSGGWILVLVMACFIFDMWRKKATTFPQLFARIGLCIAPLILLSLFGRLLWAASTHWFSGWAPPEKWECWEALYASATTIREKHMAVTEFANYAVMVSLALIAITFVVIYLALRFAVRIARFPGKVARRCLLILLVLSPCLMLIFNLADASVAKFVVQCLTSVFGGDKEEILTGEDITKLYLLSATRFAPFVLLLWPKFNLVLGVLGDVILYQVKNKALGTKERIGARLTALLAHIPCDAKVIVVAHSQGSMIAADGLVGRGARTFLLTLGSPIQVLYRDLLSIAIPSLPKNLISWKNYSRSGDYVGGEIQSATNIPHSGGKPGGHIHYWDDPQTAALVKPMIEVL